MAIRGWDRWVAGGAAITQNTSSAVMQQRTEPHDSLDDFPTPPWATRALMEHVIGPQWSNYTAFEPACGRGHMAEPLTEYFGTVGASDVHDYGYGRVEDFLMPLTPAYMDPDWVITNPPFKLAAAFIDKACSISRIGTAMLVRIAFLEGVGRYRGLFSKNPPSLIAQFSERVVIHKGKLSPKGSTATAYCWLVWYTGEHVGQHSTRFTWILPCRRRLERPDDYIGDPGRIRTRNL